MSNDDHKNRLFGTVWIIRTSTVSLFTLLAFWDQFDSTCTGNHAGLLRFSVFMCMYMHNNSTGGSHCTVIINIAF